MPINCPDCGTQMFSEEEDGEIIYTCPNPKCGTTIYDDEDE